MEDLIKQVIKKDGLDGKERFDYLNNKRMYLYYIMRRHGMKLQKIASFFNRDHATIIHGIKRYKFLRKNKNEMLKIDTEEYEQVFGKIPVPKKTYNLEKDVRKATTIGDLNIIKRRIDNNLYE